MNVTNTTGTGKAAWLTPMRLQQITRLATVAMLVTACQTAPAATISTADTRLRIEVEINGQGNAALKVASLKSPGLNADWIATNHSAQILPLISSATVVGKNAPLHWALTRDADVPNGHVFVFTCSEPALELTSLWTGYGGEAGPIEHELTISNLSAQELLLPLQSTLNLDTIVPVGLENWWVEKGAGKPSSEGLHRNPVNAGFTAALKSTPYARRSPREPVPWTTGYDPRGRRGWYVGVESSARVQIRLTRHDTGNPDLQMTAGLTPEVGYRTRLAPGASLALPPVFVGCYQGDVDDGCNRLRSWVKAHLRPSVTDPRYPLLVWNSWGIGLAVDESLSRTMIDESVDLGLEMFHIDAGWFRGVGDWQPDLKKFPNGLAPIADYAHAKGLKFGLWVGWTQGGTNLASDGYSPLSVFNTNMVDWFPSDTPAGWGPPKAFRGQTVCLGSPPAAAWCLTELRRIIKTDKLDMLEHDQPMIVQTCTRQDHLHTAAHTDVSFRAVENYYHIYDTLHRENLDLLFEDCVNGGHMVDFGVVRRVHYISITDSYDPLSNRRAFYDASYVLPPAMCECYVNNAPFTTTANFISMLRSGLMGWCSIMMDTTKWTPEQRTAAKRQFALYKSTLRPLIRDANLYHITDRPDGVIWDGIQYHNPKTGLGVMYVFRGTTKATDHRFFLKGLDPAITYQLHSEDGSLAVTNMTGAALQTDGVVLHLPEPTSSDLIFIGPPGTTFPLPVKR